MNDQSSKSRETTPQLGHVHLYVRDLDRSIDFYGRMFELKVTERIDDAMAFLTSSHQHHTLALQALGESATPPAPGSVGLYHVAFEVPTVAALEEALERLDDEGIRGQAVDHGISWAVYFDDPDGNGLEIYVDRRSTTGGRREWGGATAVLSRERIRRAAKAEHQTADDRAALNQNKPPERTPQRSKAKGDLS